MRRNKEPVRDEKRKKMGLTGTHDPVLELQVYAVLNMRRECGVLKRTGYRTDASELEGRGKKEGLYRL